MKASSHFSPTRIIAAFGFVAAGVLGWQLTGKSTASTDSAAPPDKTRVAHRANAGPPIWLTDKLAQIRQNNSFAQRLRLTISLANSVPDSEIFAWLRGNWFTLGDGFETQLFTRILKDRLDPMTRARLHLLGKSAWQETDELLALAATDPEGVIALFRENPNDIAELKILAEMAKHHPALALARFLELAAFGFPEGESHDPRSVILALSKSDPASLETALGKLPSHLQSNAERALLAHRLETSFDDEILKLYARSDGWRLFKRHLGSPEILAKLFKNPSNLPPSWRNEIAKGKDWNGAGNPSIAQFWWNADLRLAGFTEDQIQGIRKKALSGITYHSPEKALPLIETAGYSDLERKKFIQDIFSRAALTDHESETLLRLLPSDTDWQTAHEQLARKNGDTYVPIPKVDKPDQWLADFAELEPRSDADRVYRNMLTKWTDAQLADLDRQFHNLPDALKTKVAVNLVTDYGDRKGKIYGRAIQYLAATPEQHPQIIGTATNHALNWSRNDPDAAAAWVDGLPAGETRDWVQKNLASQWSSVDPTAAERWLGTLPKADQSKLRDHLKTKTAE